MHFFTTFFFLGLPLAGLAVDHRYSGLRPRHQKREPNQAPASTGGNYNLVDLYQGQTFFDGWDFFSAPDPTNGNVVFLNEKDAFDGGLAFVQGDNTTILAVDDQTPLPVGGNRASVRIQSKKSYNGGLFIADFFAMPHGCSVWPAWWSVGPDWPNAGEIDVVEGVNNQATNQMTLHTSDGCTLDRQADPDPKLRVNVATTGKILSSQCASSGVNNDGCAFVDTDVRSHGKGFNLIAGGVFAHLWEDDSIKVWHFARGEIPADIEAKNPDPTSWPTPAAVFTSASCDIKDRFQNHNLIIDTTICGDFAGSQYPQSGCPGTCAEAVADPANFKFAKWKINYIAVYE